MSGKIVNETEIRRWFEEGRTYAWMVAEYRRKYHIETTASMWGNFRRRRGLDRRITRDDGLIPWLVKAEHRHLYPVLMLRKEARRRAGLPLSARALRDLDGWKRGLKRDGVVIHYDPDTGWHRVPRRRGIDNDLIRVPDRKTTPRVNADQARAS